MHCRKAATRPWRSTLASQPASVVSFDDESLILVDSNDQVLGYASKDEAHNGSGMLHRAFSLFIFNSDGELLLQKRAADKRLWGGYWSNSVCSHPRQGEDLETATRRRLQEELGFSCPLEFVYKFEYQADFDGKGSENELCSVLIGLYNGDIAANSNEIDDWRWISASHLDQELLDHPEHFTPWFKMEWKDLKQNWAGKILQLSNTKD